jgi:hypothetical protein
MDTERPVDHVALSLAEAGGPAILELLGAAAVGAER